MSETQTLNVPYTILSYAQSKSNIQREFFVEVGDNPYVRIYLGRTHLQDGNRNVIPDYLALPDEVRMAFEILVYADIRWHVRRLEKLIAESTEELDYLRELRVK